MDAVFSAAKENNVSALSNLHQESEHSLIEAADHSGKTPITIAVENKSVDAARWLIEKGCRLSRLTVTTKDEQIHRFPPSAVSWSDSEGDKVSPRSVLVDQPYFYPPLLAAVASRCSDMATLLLETGRVDIDQAHKNVTPLIQACAEGQAEMVQLLLRHGADVNGRKVSDKEVDLHTENPKEWEHRPLYHAVEHGQDQVVELLVGHGARYVSLNPLPCHSFWGTQTSQLQRCWGSLLELAAAKCVSAVHFLLDRFKDDVTNLDVYYSLVLVVRAKRLPIVRLFLDNYYLQPVETIPGVLELSDNYWLVVRLAVRECKEEETIPILLLQRFGCLLAHDSDGNRIVSLLFVAVLRNLPGVVAKVVDILTSCFKMAELRECPAAGTLLRDVRGMALYHGNTLILQTLKKADILELSTFPEAVFEVLSCEKTQSGACVYDTLTWLVGHGMDPTQPNASGLQPIHAAVKQALPEAVAALCRLGADANALTDPRQALTPLHLHLDLCVTQLMVSPSPELIATLVIHGGDLGLVNGMGYTPLSVLFWLVGASGGRGDGGRFSTLPPLSARFRQAPGVNVRGCCSVQAAFTPVEENYGGGSGGGVERRNGRRGSDSESDASSTTSDESQSPNPRGFSRTRRTAGFDRPSSNDDDDDIDNINNTDDRTAAYLLPHSPHRPLLDALVREFGLGLLPMGAGTLLGGPGWWRVDRQLRGAGMAPRHTPSLKRLCWGRVRHSVGGVGFQRKLQLLPLPNSLKDYLKSL